MAIDAAAIEPVEPPKRKRGRPPGGGSSSASAGTARKTQKVALDLSSITGMFVGMHCLLAERTNTPELMMGLPEGEAFMGSVQNVMRHYSVQSTQKTMDWIALFGTASSMYVPRIVGYNMRKRIERSGQTRPAPTRPVQPGGQPAQPQPAQAPAPQAEVAIQPDFVGDAGFQEAAE